MELKGGLDEIQIDGINDFALYIDVLSMATIHFGSGNPACGNLLELGDISAIAFETGGEKEE